MKKNYVYKVWQIIYDKNSCCEAYNPGPGVDFSNYKDAKKYFNSIKKDGAAYSYLKTAGYLETFIYKETKYEDCDYEYEYIFEVVDYFKYIY